MLYNQMMRTTIFFIAIVSFFAATSIAGNLDFVRENIFISLALPDTLCVKGEYFFASTDGAAISSSVIYPFPVDSVLYFPHTIRVSDKSGPIGYKPQQEQAMVLIPVTIGTGETNKTTVIYRQRLKKNTGRYILTTTQAWQKPLGKSNYFITVPSGAILTFMSYQSDSVYTRGDSTVYFFSKNNFMPDKDIVFSFSKR
jgi:hypothetical protein